MTFATICVVFAGAVVGGIFWYPVAFIQGGKAKEKSLKEAEEKAIEKMKKSMG